MFLGRVVQPGEPVFLPEDSTAALALAEEERDTCQSCGLPRAYCRDNEAGRARFEVDDEFCWATYRLGLRRTKDAKEKRDEATIAATRLTPRFREGREPEIAAGLNIN